MLSVLKRREINFSRGIMFTNGTRCLHTDHWELILAATPEDNKKLSAKKMSDVGSFSFVWAVTQYPSYAFMQCILELFLSHCGVAGL